MSKFEPRPILASYASMEALTHNFERIQELLDNMVSRDGSAPNSMLADLDTNHFRIKNVADAIHPYDAVNLGQFLSVLENITTISNATIPVLDRTALALFDEPDVPVVLSEQGRDGVFVFDSSNLSTEVAADATQGIFVAPMSDTTGASGAWRRLFFGSANASWFGAGAANSTSALNSAIALFNNGTINGIEIPAGTYNVDGPLTTITRDGFTLKGQGTRRSRIVQTQNTDTLRIASSNPTTNRISDISLSDFGIEQGANPTAGIALTLDRVDRLHVSGVDIRNVYQGVLIRGGADQRWSDIVVTSPYGWTGLVSGSYLVKLTNYAGTTEVPSEIFFSNFNIKGSTSGTSHHLDTGLIIECGDGIHFSNGHLGFAYNKQIFINPQNNASLSVLNIDFSQLYVDGNSIGSTSGSAVEISGSTTPTVVGIKFEGGAIRNVKGRGFVANLTSLKDLRIVDTQFGFNGKEHIHLTGVREYLVANNTLREGNANNGSFDCIVLSDCADGNLSGNRIMAGVYPHPNGVKITAFSTDTVISDNVLKGHTTPFTIDAGCTRLNFKGNRLSGNEPSVASADGFTLPIGFDVVNITGNANMSNINAPNIENYIVTLAFPGTASFNDNLGNVNLTAAFNATAGSTLTLRNDGTKWNEVSRAVV